MKTHAKNPTRRTPRTPAAPSTPADSASAAPAVPVPANLPVPAGIPTVPVAPTVPVTADATPDADSRPTLARRTVGTGFSVTYTPGVSHPFTVGGALLNGTPGPSPRDPVTLAAPATPPSRDTLITAALALLIGSGATFPRLSVPLPGPVPADATHDAIRDYLSNRPTRTTARGYFAANAISSLDEMHFRVRAAERCIYAAFPATRRGVSFGGGYNGSDATAARRDALARFLAVNLAPADAAPVADSHA